MSVFRQHRAIIIQIIATFGGLIAIFWVTSFLPGWAMLPIRSLIVLTAGILFGLGIIFLGLQIISNFRMERSFLPEKLKIARPPVLTKFRIDNPLEGPGTFKKAQLHAHTSLSYDCSMPAAAVAQSYRDDGYSFLCLTDHDRISDFSQLSAPDFLVIPGVEVTLPVLFWPIPLGRHLVVVNPAPGSSHATLVKEQYNQAEHPDRLVIPAHLGWRGGAGTGRWYPEQLATLPGLRLVEINSPHSRDPLDLTLWNQINVAHGPLHAVWGVAVDDAHTGSRQSGWIMVKTTELTPAAFITALRNGAFYATSGPNLDVTVEGTAITVTAPTAKWIRFINAQNQVVAVFRSGQAIYCATGDEGFIRVEAEDPAGLTAWSQPMWLVDTSSK